MAKQAKKIQKNTKKNEPTLSAMLKEEVSMYDEFVEFTWGEVEIKLYPFFKPELTKDLINEFVAFLSLCKEEKVNLKDDEQEDFLCYLIIKYFTSVKTTKGKKAKTIYDEFKLVINSQFYTQIMEIFPEESIRQVQERWLQLNEVYAKFENQFKQVQKELGELDLENKEVFETLKDKGDENEIIQ